MMDCRDAREILRSLEGPVPAAGAPAEARRHADDCPHCRAWREAERAWREALQAKLPSSPVSSDVKERVFNAISEARHGRRLRRLRRRFAVLTGALAALCVAIAGV